MDLKRSRLLSALCCVGLGVASLTGVPANAQSAHKALRDLPSDRLIVKFKQADATIAAGGRVTPSALQRLRDRQGVRSKILRRMGNGSYVVSMGQAGKRSKLLSAIKQLRNDSEIAYVEPDVRMVAAGDEFFPQQWSLRNSNTGIHVQQAWDYSTGMNTVVAVLDSGILPHDDLRTNTLPGYDFISDTFIANDGSARDADATDPGDGMKAGECGNGIPSDAIHSSWHGSHVAGIIAAESDNGLGIKGVAYNAKILPVRVLGRCGGYSSDIADAIYWAAGYSVPGVKDNPRPAQVINLSLSSNNPAACGQAYIDAISAARAANVVVVAAAGNSASAAGDYSPGNCPGVITVAATGKFGGRAYYSNYGSEVSLAAPGGNMNYATDPNGILSTVNSGNFRAATDSYAPLQGTSMATPHVAGTVALMKSLERSASPDKIERILKNTTSDFPSNCGGCGRGLLNAGAAVKQMIGVTSAPPHSALDLTLGMWGLDGTLQEFQGETGIQYRVRVINNGLESVKNLTIKNILPADVRLKSLTSDTAGTCTLGNSTCVIDRLGAGERVKLTVLVLTGKQKKMKFSIEVSGNNTGLVSDDNKTSRNYGGN
ncbi:MAG: peptidase S8 [Ketobacter sp.]|nr:MAG: peptidase S8 [Ketobacter sp.]